MKSTHRAATPMTRATQAKIDQRVTIAPWVIKKSDMSSQITDKKTAVKFRGLKFLFTVAGLSLKWGGRAPV